ncbi:MAG: Mu-like prophage major head subunit gpT family protein [Candidatus Cryosericum sp.]
MPEQLRMSSRAIIGIFYEELAKSLAGSWMNQLGFLVTSNQESETYKWLGMAPGMEEWKGKRPITSLRAMPPYTLINKIFNAVLDFSIDDLRRDKTGQMRVRIGELADRAAEHWEELGSTLMLNGASDLCYDGKAFFAADHEEGNSGAQANLLTSSEVPALNVATATAPTPYEMAQAILGVVQQFYGLKDDRGKPINGNAKNFLAMVPVSFWGAAVAALTGKVLNTGAGSIDNPLQALMSNQQMQIGVLPNPYLTWTTDFAVFRTDGRAKPFIKQLEYPTKVIAIAEGSELEKNDRINRFIVEDSKNAGYGFWQHAMKATLS